MNEKIIKIILCIATFLLPAYLLRFSVLSIPTSIIELLVLSALILWGIKNAHTWAWRTFFSTYKIFITSTFLIIAGIIISTLTIGNYKTGFGALIGWFIIPMAYGFLILTIGKDNKKFLTHILFAYIASATIVALIALAYLLSGEITYDKRLTAFYLSPNHLAMYLTPALLTLFFIAQQSYASKKNFAPALLFLFLLFPLYMTFSYGAWLALIGTLLITLFVQRVFSWKMILTGILLIGILAFSQLDSTKMTDLKNLPERSSLASRAIIYEAAIKIGTDHPFTGIGPNNFQNTYLAYQKYFPPYLEWAVPHPHNLFLAFWLEAGLLGLLGFLLLIIWWMRRIIPLVKERNLLATIAFTIMIYTLLHGLIDTPYWKNDLAFLFWLVIVMGLVATSTNKKSAL